MSRSMRHINGNQLCAIDVETTGTQAGFHEIWQVAILPLDSRIKPAQDILPFYLDLKVIYPERIDPKAIKLPKGEFARKQQRAIEPFTAADLLDDWFDRLKLPIYKRICPLAQNWPFDRSFLMAWLGVEAYEHLFSPLYRDSMTAAIFHSDLCDFRSDKIKFVQYNLQYICQKLNIVNQKQHDALQDCITTAEVYRRLLVTY